MPAQGRVVVYTFSGQMSRFLTQQAVLALAVLVAGCGTPARHPSVAKNSEAQALAPRVVTDEAFGTEVDALLRSARGTAEFSSRLRGITARQMSRSFARFRMRNPERGIATLTGALTLVRSGELTKDALGPDGPSALRLAAAEFSRSGDEGRAQAVYELLSRTSEAERAEAKQHLDAIEAWKKNTATGGKYAVAGALETIAVSRALLEPSPEASREAVDRVTDWITLALELQNYFRMTRITPAREDGVEAQRALTTGANVLAALFIKEGDARGAGVALDHARVRGQASQELLSALDAVNARPTATTWMDVARALMPGSEGEGGDEVYLGLMRAGMFGAVVESYRLDPTMPESAGALASILLDLGMGEASAIVLQKSVAAHPEARFMSGALGLLLRAMGDEIDSDDAEGARRVFKYIEPILRSADRVAATERLDPNPGAIWAMMGDLELREGSLEKAAPLLTEAHSREKSGRVLLSLARIELHGQKTSAAVAHAKEALGIEDASRDPVLAAEIHVLLSEAAREAGDLTGARAELVTAATDLSRARIKAQGLSLARIERSLARVLDRLGAAKLAENALARSLDASSRDKRQSGAALSQLIARALVRGDLKTARDGLARAVAAELSPEDLVYMAMWVRCLERAQRAKPDGAAEKILSASVEDPRWVGKVSAFGTGRLAGALLIAQARTAAQQAEALFYTAMDRRAVGDTKASDEALNRVAKSPGLDLVEVQMAKDLLLGAKANLPGPLPELGLP